MSWTVALAMVAVGVGVTFYSRFFSPRAKLLRQFRKKGLVAIAAAGENETARFVGRVAYFDPPLEAPLTGRQCVCYEATLDEQRSTGKSSHWVVVGRQKDSVRIFALEGEHETAIVELTLATVLIVDDRHTTSGFLDNPTQSEQQFAERMGHSTQGLIFNKSLRYREGVIEAGELVAVFGKCTFERDPTPGAAGGYRGQAIRKRIVRPEGEDMLLSDEPEAARYK